MSLKTEIAALRALMDEHARTAAAAAPPPAAPPTPTPEEAGAEPVGFDALLATVSEMIEDIGEDVDRYPRLTALAAFALGLSLGTVLAPRDR